MKKILLVEPNDVLRSILKLNIMSAIGSDVIEEKIETEALPLVANGSGIDVIVCREQNNIISKEHSIPLVLIKSDDEWKDVVNSVGLLLGVDVNFEENKYNSKFVGVGIEYFELTAGKSLGTDVYVRMKKGDSFQYLKCLHSTDCFTKGDIEKYKSAGLEELFIFKNNFSHFVNVVTTQLSTNLVSDKVTDIDRLKVMNEAYDLSSERIRLLGIDEYTIAIVEQNIKSMSASLEKNDALFVFFQSLKKNKLTYAYSHAYLCSLLLIKVVNNLEWQSHLIKEKLVYIAYFHDISLSENLMEYNNEDVVKNSQLNDMDKARILNHANMSAGIVERFPQVPQGVATVIKEHHGAKNGIGFPDAMTLSISPISMMFIVIEAFVNEFLKIEGEPKLHHIEEILGKLGVKYNHQTYERTLVALEKIMLI
jgi:hypothetical protein